MRPDSRLVLTGLVALAVLRICLTAFSFPIFGNNDELAHVDMVDKYSRQWHPPEDVVQREILEVFILHNSPEFGVPPGPEGVARLPSQFDWSDADRDAHVEATLAALGPLPNNETCEGAVYYWIAGQWWKFGRQVLGLDWIDAILWTRMLGAVLLAGMMLFGIAILRRVAPDRPYLVLGTTLLFAVWPQDSFAFVTNDGATGLFGAAAVWALFRARDADTVAAWAFTGVAFGITIAAKISNVMVAFAVPVVMWPWIRRMFSDRAALLRLGVVGVTTLIPVLTWAAILHAYTGYWFGTAHKAKVLGMAPHGLDAMLAHPIWSLEGQGYYWPPLVAHSWRGETFWHGEPMGVPWADTVMIVVTMAAITAFFLTLLTGRAKLPTLVGLAAIAAIAMAGISQYWFTIAYDWGTNAYPSREHPFSTSGRLHAPVAVLFFPAFLEGLRVLVDRFGSRAKWIALALVVATLIVSELLVMIPVLSSPHSFWHLNG